MAKINKGYRSVLAYMADHQFPLAARINKFFNPNEVPLKERYIRFPDKDKLTQMMGALQPIEDMAKDLNNFKPYKSRSHLIRDLLSPLHGLLNIIKGVATLVGATLLFFINFAKAAFSGSRANFVNQMRANLYNTASWFVNGVLNIVRGVSQIVACVYMSIKAAVRSRHASPTLTENMGVERLVKDGRDLVILLVNPSEKDEARARLITLLHALDRKYKKAEKNGQQIFTFIGQSNKLTKDEAQQLKQATAEKDKLLLKAVAPNATENDILNFLYLFGKDSDPVDTARILNVITPKTAQLFDSSKSKPTAVKNDDNLFTAKTPKGKVVFASGPGVFSGKPKQKIQSLDDIGVRDTDELNPPKPPGFAVFD